MQRHCEGGVRPRRCSREPCGQVPCSGQGRLGWRGWVGLPRWQRHVLRALLLAAKVLGAGLIVTVRAVECRFDMFDIGRGRKGVPVFKEG